MSNQISQGIKNRRGFSDRKKFKNHKTHLSIKYKGVPYKFCKECGFLFRNESKRLKDHYLNQHNSSYPEYLLFDEYPKNCRYSNFEEYLNDPTINLISTQPILCNKGGRPRKLDWMSLGNDMADEFIISDMPDRPIEKLEFDTKHNKTSLLTKRAGMYGHE